MHPVLLSFLRVFFPAWDLKVKGGNHWCTRVFRNCSLRRQIQEIFWNTLCHASLLFQNLRPGNRLLYTYKQCYFQGSRFARPRLFLAGWLLWKRETNCFGSVRKCNFYICKMCTLLGLYPLNVYSPGLSAQQQL